MMINQTRVPLVDLKAQYATIKPAIDAAIQRVVTNTSFIGGKEVSGFEGAFADFCAARHAVGMASGTAALHLALEACGVKAGDEVITTPHTFFATAEPISLIGARPVFVDIDPRTFNIDPHAIEAAIGPRTRAIVPVHLYGQPAEMDPILAVAARHHLRVIEDAAQGHGAEYRGRRVGTFGDVSCFSFYPGKNLGAYGDAGATVTNDDGLAERMRMLRDHGRTSKYEHLVVGYGYRLDALQAAILAAKLPHLDAWNDRRRAIARLYTEQLASSSVVEPPHVPAHINPVFHLYVVRCARRDALLQHLKAQGIEAGIHYPVPLHLQPAYRELGYKAGAFPQTERAANEVLSLPIYPEMTSADVQQVVDAVKGFGL